MQLPTVPTAHPQHKSRSLHVDGAPLLMDELGPVVIQKNGTLGRLSNWHEMTMHEKEAAQKFIAKRNAGRRADLLRQTADSEAS
jgi:hypothetical protein